MPETAGGPNDEPQPNSGPTVGSMSSSQPGAARSTQAPRVDQL